MTELIIVLGQKSLYIGNNTKTRLYKGLNICREKMGTRYPGFTPRFWSESPNPNYYAQNRIAGIALSELVDFPEIYREVYFPTVEALIPLSKKVDRVVFLLWETPHNRQEFSEHWWDTATLAPVLKAYLSNQGVTNVGFETLQVSSVDNAEEVQVKYWYSLFPGVGRLRLENNLSAWMDEQYELWMGRKGRPLPPKYGRLIIHYPY